jgi:putative membrane protein
MIVASPLQARTEPPASLSPDDRAFLEKAAQANLAEIDVGKLAQAKATRDDLKKFGAKMALDHGKTLKELQALAVKKGITLPKAPDDAHKAQATALSRASGREFDLTYVKNAGVADHWAAKELFQSGTQSNDASIRAFAQKVLPEIQHHLEMAESLSKNM